jgi:hypothetical protein
MSLIKPRMVPLCAVYKILKLPLKAKLWAAKYKTAAIIHSKTFFPVLFHLE